VDNIKQKIGKETTLVLEEYIRKYINLIYICAVLALIPAFRGDTRDTDVYRGLFYSIVEFPSDPYRYYQENNVEWAFGVLAWVCRFFISDSSIVFFYIYSFSTFFVICCAAINFNVRPLYVMCFYLPSFFLLQQLMQIRQGLASGLGFLAISYLKAGADHRLSDSIKFSTLAVLAVLTHTALIPVVAIAVVYRIILIRRFSHKIISLSFYLICCFIFIKGFGAGFFDMQANRIDEYSKHDEFGVSRSVFDPANVRTMLVLLFLICGWIFNKYCRSDTGFNFLLFLYWSGLVSRLALGDVSVLSGRFGAVFSFCEIFAMPMVIAYSVTVLRYRIVIMASYVIAQGCVTLIWQAPFIIYDYFS
jgi:hypothetical protein